MHRLTGADHFHLLIDRQMRAKGLPGNISRMHLHLAPETDLPALHERLNRSPVLHLVSRLRLRHRWPQAPYWAEVEVPSPAAFLHPVMSWKLFNEHVVQSTISATGVPVRVDLCPLEDGSKHLLLSMHHALFDHRGMMLFLRALAQDTVPERPFVDEPSRPWALEASDALKGMFAALGSGGWKLATLPPPNARPKGLPSITECALSEEETRMVDANALQNGARMGRSIFYLSCVLVALRELLEARGLQPPYFWVPVPHDLRRKGAAGHLVGNQLSFLFFKVHREDLASVPTTVDALQEQLTRQVRSGALHHQAALQRVFRFIPFWLMNAMVGLTTGGRVSSLAFSDLGEDRQPLQEFLGWEVMGIDHIPPVPSPPGLSVVVMRENGRLRVVLASAGEALSETERSWLSGRLEHLLTGL